MAERYINPFTDFGFKKLFGEEANKDLLIDFLNEVLREEQDKIVSLTFLKPEQLGGRKFERKAIFDLYCKNENGERFIVELQKAKQDYFKDRALFYSTFPIREQAEKGDWNFELKKIYTIAILDFVFDEDKNDPDKFLYFVKLSDIETHSVFYDKLTFVYLEMPKVNKPLEALESHFDKWLYVLRNLNHLERLPEKLQEQIFHKLFSQAEIANLSGHELEDYEESLKVYRDLKNVIDTAENDGWKRGKIEGREEGRKEGREEGHKAGEKKAKLYIATQMRQNGFSGKDISQLTGLTPEEIDTL